MQIHHVGQLSDLQKTTPSECFTLLYVDKGRGRVRLGDAVYTVEEGEAFLVLPTFSIEKVGDWNSVKGNFIYFSGGETLGEENGTLYPDETAKKLLRENNGEEANMLFMHLRKEQNKDLLPRKLRAYIRENPALSPEMVAETLGISTAKLGKICRETFGCGFGTYVRAARITRAKHLLKNPTLTVSEIAARLGYSSARYFSVAFKNKTGFSPSDYRKYAIKRTG